jgi:transcriptional regulator with XRE-family HTH domain
MQMAAAEIFRVNLRAIMVERGLTIQQLADLVGTARPNMSRILSGKEGLSIDRAEHMAEALGVELTDLLSSVEKIRQTA